VVERLGTYSGTLGAGFHVLTPFVDVIRYRHSLKEQTMDIPEQICITRDNVQVGVDGVLYMKVLDAHAHPTAISDYRFRHPCSFARPRCAARSQNRAGSDFEERTNIIPKWSPKWTRIRTWGVQNLHVQHAIHAHLDVVARDAYLLRMSMVCSFKECGSGSRPRTESAHGIRRERAAVGSRRSTTKAFCCGTTTAVLIRTMITRNARQ